MTVGAWADQWFTQRVGKWNPNTEGGYRNLIYNHIIPGVGRAGLTDLTARKIQSFYKRLTQNGLGARSVWCVHLLLRRCLDEACREGQIPLNPARLCNVPQTEEHQTIPLRLGQLQRYLNAAEKLGAPPITKPRSRPTTYAAHDYVFRNHILPGLGGIHLDELTETVVGAFPPN